MDPPALVRLTSALPSTKQNNKLCDLYPNSCHKNERLEPSLPGDSPRATPTPECNSPTKLRQRVASTEAVETAVTALRPRSTRNDKDWSEFDEAAEILCSC